MRGLLSRALADGSLDGPRDVDAQASLIVASMMGACMIPPFRPALLRDTIAELERSLGLR